MSYLAKCLLAASLILFLGVVDLARAQCMLANPSFELGGQGGHVFGGWEQSGSIGATSNATHGQVAARVTSPNAGPGQVSDFHQALDTEPGERWAASVAVWHSSSRPLTGQSRALLKIEWRDAADQLISDESHTVADATTPVEEPIVFSVESQPAPAGAVKTRLLLGVLQGPGDPVADVFFDQATFVSLTPPTLDELQWSDFWSGQTVDFGGRTWRVKGPGYYGPGPDHFCNTPSCVWVDASDRLHMTIRKFGNTWYSTEVALEQSLGYGDYVFTVLGPLDQWHPNVVLGMFLWEYGKCYDPAYLWWNPHNEIDVEISRWGNPFSQTCQFVAQPYDYPGNLSRYDGTAGDPDTTSHAFRWLPDRVEFRAWRGGPGDESPENLIHSWTYTGPHIPRPDQPRVHINLWQFQDPPDTDQEAVIESFTFQPACVGPLCGPLAVAPPPAAAASLSSARPNPFDDRTTIRYAVAREGVVEIAVYDVAGRRVRVLEKRVVPAGDHEVAWDGRDGSGGRVASGVYLYRIRLGGRAETRRVVVLE